MQKHKKELTKLSGIAASVLALSACVAKDVTWNEQQVRMQRCEQYVDHLRAQCLQGEFVSIQDYKEEYKKFKESKQAEKEAEEARKQKLKLAPVPPITYSQDEP